MPSQNQWKISSWYCAGCGKRMSGALGKNGKYKAVCSRCKIIMFRSFESRRRDIYEIYYPDDRGCDLLFTSNSITTERSG